MCLGISTSYYSTSTSFRQIILPRGLDFAARSYAANTQNLIGNTRICSRLTVFAFLVSSVSCEQIRLAHDLHSTPAFVSLHHTNNKV